MKTKLLFSCAAALLLAGCLSTPVRQTNWRPQDEGADFSADGRLAVRTRGKVNLCLTIFCLAAAR